MNPKAGYGANLKTGSESLFHSGEVLPFTLLHFWQWSLSDLLSNATRGRFAEFIVATALGSDVSQFRREWDSFDLLSREGIKTEVKSAAYLQSWEQRKPSKIRFSIKPAREYSYETNVYVELPARTANVYVFCLFHNADKTTANLLDLGQWEFYVLSTPFLNAEYGSSGSISLKVLQRNCKPVSYSMLAEEVNACHNLAVALQA
ncbi:MAG: hypothetical protein V4543_05600 [Bacteroidota bacterium]